MSSGRAGSALSRRTLGRALLPATVLLAAEPASASGTPREDALGPVSVVELGAKGDGRTDDTAAFEKSIALAEAGTSRRSILVPSGGTYRITRPLNLNESTMWSDGLGACLAFSELGAGAAALRLTGAANAMNRRPSLFNLYVKGPARHFQLGASASKMDGIVLGAPDGGAQPQLRRVFVTGFRSGIVLAAADGHVVLDSVGANENYYGVYIREGHGDTALIDCQLGGNSFAGIAMPCTAGLGGGFYASMCTFGFQPYGIYQEPGACTVPFMSDVVLQGRFEAIGNGALISDATGRGEGGKFESVRIFGAGFSWSDEHRLESQPRDYCLRFPYADGINVIEQGVYPFIPGDRGLIQCGGTGRFELVYSGRWQPRAEDVLYDGTPEVAAGSRVRTKGNPVRELVIGKGERSASVSVQTNLFAFSTEGIVARAVPLTDPGSSWWLEREAVGPHTQLGISLAGPAPAPVRFHLSLDG